jgi:hypothetical protein
MHLFVLVPILSKLLFALMGCDLLELALSSAGHQPLLSALKQGI